jgi:rhodanese-related sulfurtransferase
MKALLLFLPFGLFLTGCGLNTTAGAEESEARPEVMSKIAAEIKEVDHVDVATFKKMVEAEPEAQLIDVRSRAEFAAGHLANSINIDVNDTAFMQMAGKLDPARKVYVYCAVGGRSRMAAGKLADMGYEVVNMSNGITAWQAAGYPTVK